MSRNRRVRSGGNSLVEFTFVGIPLLFLLVSTFEMSRGMWMYNTLSFAVRAGTRYAVVHGQDCAISPNNCTVPISKIAAVIRAAGPGLPINRVTLVFTPWTGTPTTCTLDQCLTMTTGYWPPSGANAPGQKVKITGSLPFSSSIAMFWPGAGKATRYSRVVNLTAASREAIQF